MFNVNMIIKVNLWLSIIFVTFHFINASVNNPPDENEGEVCYEGLGCVSISAPYICERRSVPLPMHPEVMQTEILLYQDPRAGQFNVTVRPKISLGGTTYDVALETYVIVHGANSSGHTKWVQSMKDAILNSRPANVFVVSWPKGAAYNARHQQSVANTLIVGRQLGILLIEAILFNIDGMNEAQLQERAQRIKLIGHSFGAQICGYGAKYVTEILNVKIGSIVALDAGQIFFENYDPLVRITKDDTDQLIAIHTNCVLVDTLYGCGTMEPYGHVDIYINGGVHQPGCPLPHYQNFSDAYTMELSIFEANLCSRDNAHAYYTDAILNPECKYFGCKLPNQIVRNAVRKMANGDWSEFNSLIVNCPLEDEVNLKLDIEIEDTDDSYFVFTRQSRPYCVTDAMNDVWTSAIDGIAAYEECDDLMRNYGLHHFDF